MSMAAVSMEAGEILCYYGSSLWDEGEYLGFGNGRFHLRLTLDVPKTLEGLAVSVSFRLNTSDAPGHNDFYATLTQEEQRPEEKDAVFKFTGDGRRHAAFAVNRKLRRGRWYLWLWSDFTSVREILNGVTELRLGGEAAAAGFVYRNGVWQGAEGAVYKDGVWQSVCAAQYREGWEELA